jgi:hypothetical protein
MRKNKTKKLVEAKFGITVSSLTDYVDEQSTEIIPALIYDGRTAQLIQVMEGVKETQKIKLFDGTTTLQPATSCGRNALGGGTFTDVDMVVAPIMINENYCSEDLIGKWTQLGLPNGVRNQREDLAYEDLLIAFKSDKIRELNEVGIWQGDTDSISANLLNYDGFKKKFDADGSVANINTTGVTAFTSANIVGILVAVRNALPLKVLQGNHKIFVGKEVFDMYCAAVINGNLFHYKLENDGLSAQLYGYNTIIECVYGLNGTSSIYAGNTDLMFIGTDMEHDWEDFSVKYSDETDQIYLDVKYRLGVQYVYPDQFKKYTLAAS